MTIFFRVSDKELVALRNNVFKERGMPALTKAGFVRTPFSTGWFGRDDAGGYSYEFCRLSDDSRLDFVFVYINKGDRWVQLKINVFKLHPKVDDIEKLRGVDGLQFHLPPNSRSLTRLSCPPGLIFAGSPKHKVGLFFSRAGLKKQLERLGELLESDLTNIDGFFQRWMAEYKPLPTDWTGCEMSE